MSLGRQIPPLKRLKPWRIWRSTSASAWRRGGRGLWWTGYSTDFSWLHVDYPTGDDGWPVEDRGVVSDVPGLYFMGLLFQYAFASMLIGGAGRDAKHVARHILRSPAGAAIQTKSERAASASG